jgi:4-amino-4-deoxy-L-arabinose transferase-like glycosyltransferase
MAKKTNDSAAPGGTPKGILEDILGPAGWTLLTQNPIAKAYLSIPLPRRDVLTSCVVSALIFIPWLGAVGLWDCWEPHYGEVARTMIAKHDFVYPWWESTNFLSKPAGLMWFEVIPMLLAGTLSKVGPVGIYTEWFMRVPVAGLAILAVGMTTYTAGRLFNRRVGLIAGFAMATSPLYFFLARQATTDMPFVSCLVVGVCCFAIAEFDPSLRVPEGKPGAGLPDPKRAAIWWYCLYAFVGVAVLFKSMLPAGLAGLSILLYLVASGDWAMLKRARIPTGGLLFFCIVAPWIILLCFFPGKDDEGEIFLHRYFIHDLFNRLFVGVHTTTPKDSVNFTYFIEQLGYGLFPWVAMVPGAMAAAMKGRPRDPNPKNRAVFFFAVLAVATFTVMSLSATEFHHYGFPVIPPLCILFALWADQVWEEGLNAHDIAILTGMALYAMVAQNLVMKPKHFTDLFVYNYERPYPAAEIDPAAKNVFGVIFGVGGLMIAGAYLMRAKEMLFAGFATVALVFALYTSWIHWRRLTYHWSQRDIFWTYYEDACPPETHGECNPDAPIAAYLMNWRGETFYSQNRVRQIPAQDSARKLMDFVNQPGKKYVIVEQSRYQGMTQILGERYHPRILDKSCNKFFLVGVD